VAVPKGSPQKEAIPFTGSGKSSDLKRRGKDNPDLPS